MYIANRACYFFVLLFGVVGEASDFIASHMVRTNGKTIAADLFVELTIAALKRLVGQQRGVIDRNRLCDLASSAGFVESLWSSSGIARLVGPRTIGHHDDIAAKVAAIAATTASLIKMHGIHVYSGATSSSASDWFTKAPKGFETPDRALDDAQRYVYEQQRRYRRVRDPAAAAVDNDAIVATADDDNDNDDDDDDDGDDDAEGDDDDVDADGQWLSRDPIELRDGNDNDTNGDDNNFDDDIFQ